MRFNFSLLAIFYSLISIYLNAGEIENSKTSIQREEEIRIILEQSFLKEERFDKIAERYANQIVDKEGKELPIEFVVNRLNQMIRSEEFMDQLMQPYHVFSDEEIHELRKIFENKTFLKYTEFSFPIVKANIQVMENVLNTMIQQNFQVSQDSSKMIQELEEIEDQRLEILELTKDNFHEEVEETDQPVIIDVYAHWCPPCRDFAPIFETLHEKYKNDCLFAQVNSDQETLLVNFLKARAYPTMIFMHKGKVISRAVGYMSEKEFDKKIKDFLKELK